MHTDGVTVFSQWPLQHFFDYIFSFDSIVSNLQYPRECQGELWIVVRGDGLPCGGESWCQMSISFANHGHLARTLSYHWTVNVALCGEKSTSVLSQVWANNLAFLQSALDTGVLPIRGASRRCRIFCGGDSPWLRRLSGVTTHWMAGSLFTYMTWCKSSATWLQQDVDRTTERDEQLLGLIAPGAKCRPMDIFGVVQSRLLKVPLRRRHLIPCVRHLLIFVGRQALVRRLAKSVRPSTRVSVQAILHRSGCHIALQGTAEPDGEETWCLLKVWEDLAPLLGGDMRMHTAVVAMYMLLGDMYGTMFEEGALQAPEVAQAFQRWVCPAIRSPYINWMLHDATVTIQAIKPYGLGMFSGDLLEGSNRVLKDIWSSFCDRAKRKAYEELGKWQSWWETYEADDIEDLCPDPKTMRMSPSKPPTPKKKKPQGGPPAQPPAPPQGDKKPAEAAAPAEAPAVAAQEEEAPAPAAAAAQEDDAPAPPQEGGAPAATPQEG